MAISYDEYVKKRKKNQGYYESEKLIKEYLNSKETLKPSDYAKSPKEEKRSWFKSGSFDDGYDFGDVTKTLIGTSKDLTDDLFTGVARIGEGVADVGAYIVGGGAKLLGNDKLADNTKEFISRNLVDEYKIGEKLAATNSIGIAYRLFNNMLNKGKTEENSFLGEKSDSLVQSAGQLAGTIALQSVGVPWWLTTGTTSFAGGTEEAFKDDASYGKAGAYGLISAGAEILTEKISGGISFGGKTLDTGLKKVIGEKIANKTLSTLAKFGLDAVGEGGEEVLTEVLQNVGKKLTYEDEKTWNELLTSEEAMDSYLESFIGGAVLGGGMNTIKVANSIKTGRDYDTGLTDNEQKIVDKEVENRKQEAQKEGKKLSNKEIAKIEEQVKNDLQKGYISTDLIESEFGGEEYKAYKSTLDKKTAIESEIKELENKHYAELTVKENERLQAIREELKGIDTNTLKSNLESSMANKIAKDGYLQNSYHEKNKRSVKFNTDLSKYDAKQQETIKKAIDSGILNDTNKTHEFVDMIAKISADKGVSFDFANNQKLKDSGFAIEGKQVNGFVNENGITLNMDSSKALNKVVGHEITHVLEGTELYTELQNALMEYDITKKEYGTRYNELKKLYKGVKDADIKKELTADLVGDYIFNDPDFVNNLSTKKPNVFKKIYDEIKYLLKIATAGSKEARQLEKVKKIFEDAYKQNATQTETGVKYAISEKGTLQDSEGNDVKLETSEAGTHGTLMVIHNLNADKLKGIIELGGFPVPSIAITNPNLINHSSFGDISVLFDKSTIDPTDRRNEVFDRDVWSPTFPTIEYEINTKVLNKVRNIVGGYGNEYLSHANSKLNNIEDSINKRGYEEFINELKNNKDFKYVYYKNLNPNFEVLTKITSEDISTRYPNETLREFINIYSKEIPHWGSISTEQRNEIVEKFKDMWIPRLEAKRDSIIAEEKAKENPRMFVIGMAKSSVENNLEWLDSLGGQDKLIENLNEIQRTKGTKEVKDYDSTNKYINENINQKDYENWLKDIFNGIVGKKGIYNGKDYMTPSGNRRTFNQLHEDYNLANLVKVLTKKDTVGGQSGFGAGQNFGTLQAKMSNKFNSIEEIKQAEERLQFNEDTKELVDGYSERIYGYMSDLREYSYNKSTDYYYGDNAGYALNDFAEYKTQNITNLKKALENNGINSKEVPAELLESIVKDINELKYIPTDYFEAKPQRAVGLDEVQAIVIPNNVDAEFKQQLQDAGLKYYEYDPNIEGDRQRVINQFDDLKFSLSSQNQDIAPSRNDVFGTDIKLQVEEAIAPLKEEIAELKEELAPVKQTEYENKALTEAEAEEYFNEYKESPVNNVPPVETEQTYDYIPDTMSMDNKSLNALSKNIKKELNLNKVQTTELEKVIQEFSNSETATKEDLFDTIQERFSEQTIEHKNEELVDIKRELRNRRIYVDDYLKSEFRDGFNKIRQKNFNKLKFTNDGMEVDSVYQELSELYPAYFPDYIGNAQDRLLRIIEVANEDVIEIENYVMPEETIQDITDFVYDSIQDYKLDQHLKAVEEARKSPVDESLIPPEEDIAPVVNASNKKISESNVPIGELSDRAREPIDLDKAKQLTIDGTEENLVTKTKKELRKALLGTEAQKEFILGALDNAKNRSMALMNNTDTIRNNELVFGRDAGKMINEVIFQKEIDNEADSIAWQNKERDEIKALGIKARSKESAAVQKYGEKQYVETNGELVSYTDEDLAREFPNVETQEKIKRAAQVIRNKYDNYIDVANGVLTKLGFDPIPKRKDYMRHFQELTDVFSTFGIPFNAQSMTEHTLPTDINGLTDTFTPQKNFFANMQQRKGLKTTYDAITGVDGYIGGIANLIYHTEDIQRFRAFEELIRETYGEDKGFENLDNLPDELKQVRAEKIQDNHMSNYSAWLHELTNHVAGKKSKIDRSVESMFGRKAFSFLDGTRKQVGANMIGFNLSSSLTNLIAPVQAMAKTNKLAVLKGTADTIKNMFVKDDFMNKNKFLTSRMGTDMLSKNAWQKVQDAGFVFMKGMDWFSSNQIVRSKYYELRAKGMSEQQAHAEAGQFAARIMGDRTKGANAQLYNSKLVGLVTQFQLEVNNQLYSMFYDTYQESKENAKGNALRTTAGMTFTLGQLFAFTHLFGKTFEAIAGYNPTFDVIGMLATALGWGEDEEEEKTTSERLKDAADQLVDALPYVNILTGGGRIPVASGIPNLVGVATGGKDQYGNELTLEDELKKLLFLIPPTGGNQVKKTYQGLSMFDEDLPVSGSYTDSGNLRFPVEDTPLNRLQAGIFGQWANENARDYFDNERMPLKEKQIQEYKDLDMPISEYWEYREGLKDKSKTEEKFEYINSLDVSDEQKNIMINNALTRKEQVDMSGYDDFGGYEEFDFATKNPEKYEIITQIDTYDNYISYKDDIASIKEQFSNENGFSTAERKQAVFQYINSLSIGIPQKIMLMKMAGGYSIKPYSNEMFEYINSLPMTIEEKERMYNQLFG